MTNYLDFEGLCKMFYGDNMPPEAVEEDYEPDVDLQVKAMKEDALID